MVRPDNIKSKFFLGDVEAVMRGGAQQVPRAPTSPKCMSW